LLKARPDFGGNGGRDGKKFGEKIFPSSQLLQSFFQNIALKGVAMHCLMASEFPPGQLIFMSNLPSQVVKKVKLHH
jgi:hypothetical protein